MALWCLALLPVLAAAVLAQSSSPLITSTVSSACSGYLQTLDDSTTLAACLNPAVASLASFSPAANGTATAASVPSALDTFCGPSVASQCSQSIFSSELSAFSTACQPELSGSANPDVRLLYDALYVFVSARLAMCSKDDSGDYCVVKLSNASNSSQLQSTLGSYLYTTITGSNSTLYAPNTTTIESSNILFLLLQPSTPAAQLCTTCTRGILTPYITFESNVPSTVGISQSTLISGQPTLYNAIIQTCGASFLSGAVQAAGGLSSGLANGAAPRAGGHELSVTVGAILGAAVLAVASL